MLEEVYISEATFAVAVLLSIQDSVNDLPIRKEWAGDQLPSVCSAIIDMYGWVQCREMPEYTAFEGRSELRLLVNHDQFKEAFEDLVPHEIRHKSGAFLTPDWMADHLLERLCPASDFMSNRFLEPCAGTGAFLIAIARKLRVAMSEGSCSSAEAARFLSVNCTFVERNPIACFALLANYLFTLSSLTGSVVSVQNARGVILLSDCVGEYMGETRERDGWLFDELPVRNSFDYVVGNPPWISWETLDREYRARVAPLWRELGLFAGTGASKAFSKEDISSLITYVCVDRFLANRGEISFIIPQSILQSSLNSRGFRRFELLGIASRTPLKVVRVDDMTKIPAFKGASARAAILTLRKGEENSYPVQYNVFTRHGPRGGESLSEMRYIAEPSDPEVLESAWSIHDPISGSEKLRRISGKCPYRARAGVFTGGANAAYYLQGCRVEGGLIAASTVSERAKRKLESRRVLVEPDFVFPFLRGRDVSKWVVDMDPSRAIIVPHTSDTRMAPVRKEFLERNAPRTLDYFLSVKDFLDERKGLTAMDRANADIGFYAVMRVGSYTFSTYKLFWRYIAKEFICAVSGPVEFAGTLKPIIPQEKLMMIDFQSADEAFFVCGVLGSSIFSTAIENRMVGTQISARIIDGLRVPKYSPDDVDHQSVSRLCKEGHELARDGKDIAWHRSEIDSIIEGMVERYN
ncbi:hypothetical protein D3C71_1079830 [compost metagenome]